MHKLPLIPYKENGAYELLVSLQNIHLVVITIWL